MEDKDLKVGDKVRINSLDWYNDSKNGYGYVVGRDQIFVDDMSKACGKVLTIQAIEDDCENCTQIFILEGSTKSWRSWMFSEKVDMTSFETKTIVPEGMTIDRENSTLDCIKFIPLKGLGYDEVKKLQDDDLPFSMSRYQLHYDGYDNSLNTNAFPDGCPVFPTFDLAKANVALSKLLMLRQYYRRTEYLNKAKKQYCRYVIFLNRETNKIEVGENSKKHSSLFSFYEQKSRDSFLNSEGTRELFETAKPLL